MEVLVLFCCTLPTNFLRVYVLVSSEANVSEWQMIGAAFEYRQRT